ncbi:type I-E CRISPR-associated protein Cas5/CasD [Actinoplanes sp. NPDC049596]|uniref:type I-E CRISPR-associated protein Cas5/CasD n=1 Tax=unclassified Actinoplanes TaxID=2626549 RepID=UPI0034468C6B
MNTLVLLLAGPMQSWGERAAFSRRDTLAYPTRSGIVGMLACALGQPRTTALDWADNLTVHVRADHPGHLMQDFHTIGGGYPADHGMRNAEGKPRKNKHGQASGTLTYRHYLADAAFTATVTVEDDALAARLAAALTQPRWPLYLGRKSCPPAYRVLLGTSATPGEQVLHSLPAYTPMPRATRPPRTDWFAMIAAATNEASEDDQDQVSTVERVVYLDGVPAADAYTITRDNPVAFTNGYRTYRNRTVGQDLATVAAAGTGITAWKTMRDALAILT